MKAYLFSRLVFVLVFALFCFFAPAQQITGVWKGKTKNTRIELKLVKSGDSLVGNAYYYSSRNNYRKYSIKGYFDPETNNVIWWDDVLIEDKAAHGFFGGAMPDALLTVADFNCPGETEMRLDGTSSLRDDRETVKGPINLQKGGTPLFSDPWDWVIDNYTAGANDPTIIDSIALLTAGPKYFPEEKLPAPAAHVAVVPAPPPVAAPPVAVAPPSVVAQQPVAIAPPAPAPLPAAPAPAPVETLTTNEKKFRSRKNNLQMVIPFKPGKSIELRFYDDASIDGDSIAIFLNGHVVREHILLGGEPQTIQINSDDLQDDNELVVVAENLGAIPPNTSYLYAAVGNKKYEARLFADEHTSALIRFVKDGK